ncbi:hypothetical protein [Nocardioides sp. SYSU D00065]|uniref:hypothetical protein n=1 Tax=Nocardioides sp. SYSU D00065 TaxID=2817378 RepID=UPI001B32C4F3|nr:hypothetical protein [Nocardioides sp. SYSU D00065]
MTDRDLRDLFREAAPEHERPDPAAVDRAWRDGLRRRAGHRVVFVGAVAATVATVAGFVVLGRPSSQVAPAPTGPTSTPSTQSPATKDVEDDGPDATIGGAPVWISPHEGEDPSDLPLFSGTGLPEEIDLSADMPGVGELSRAIGVIGVVGNDGELSRVVAIGPDGSAYSLDIDGRVERVTDQGGNAMSPLSDEGLSPDGTRVFFRQERALVVYDFSARAWSEMTTPQWTAETARWLDGGIFVPTEPWGSVGTVYSIDGARSELRTLRTAEWDGGEAYGPKRSSSAGDVAQSYFLSTDSGDDRFAGVNAVVVTVEGRPRILAHDTYDLRGKMCCPVAGWLAPTVVAFQAGPQLLAWSVPHEGVRRVTELTGLSFGEESHVASWALPPR